MSNQPKKAPNDAPMIKKGVLPQECKENKQPAKRSSKQAEKQNQLEGFDVISRLDKNARSDSR
jgi:hypothetical protein